METLRFCFDANPRHRDVVKHIREKYEFSERPQKGIVVQSASATPRSLSADNYMGTLYSHVMLAQVDSHRGASIEWVREDDRAIRDNGGAFPTEPGVYYIQIEDITPQGDVPEFQFWVDPLLTEYDEPVITFDTGTETNAILAHAPVLEDSVNLYHYPDALLFEGTALTFRAAQSLYIGGSETDLLLGHEEGYVSVSTQTQSGPFTIQSTTNTLELEINGTPITVTLPTGNLLADEVMDEIVAEAMSESIDGTTYSVSVSSNAVTIEADQSLQVGTGSANTPLGLSSGYVAPEVTGLMVQPHVPADATFQAVVDGTTHQFTLLSGNREVDSIALEIEQAFSATSLTVDTAPGGDYSLDPATGEITFLHDFEPGTKITADYKYPDDSQGPFPIGGGEVSNSEAIPGVVIAFGTHLEDGDVMAIVVEEERSDVSDVYGGKFDMSLDFDIIARDSMTRSEMVDLIIMYLWQWRRERLAEEGIIIESVSMGGESEEPYDDTGDDYYYLSSISLSLMTDWEIHIAKPLHIRRITPTTYDYDARMAERSYMEERPDLFLTSEMDLSQVYLVDGKGGIERIR